jgi:hypothetical protein
MFSKEFALLSTANIILPHTLVSSATVEVVEDGAKRLEWKLPHHRCDVMDRRAGCRDSPGK